MLDGVYEVLPASRGVRIPRVDSAIPVPQPLPHASVPPAKSCVLGRTDEATKQARAAELLGRVKRQFDASQRHGVLQD